MRSRRPLSGLALATAAGVTAALVVAGTAAAQAPADPFAAFGVLHQGTAPDLAALKINPTGLGFGGVDPASLRVVPLGLHNETVMVATTRTGLVCVLRKHAGGPVTSPRRPGHPGSRRVAARIGTWAPPEPSAPAPIWWRAACW